MKASTKRSLYIEGAYQNVVTQIAVLRCWPLDPASNEWQVRFPLDPPHILRMTMIEGGQDVKAGDTLVVGAKEYPILFVADADWMRTRFARLVLDDVIGGA